MDLKDLKALREEKMERANAIRNGAKALGQELSEDNLTELEAIADEVGSLNDQIEQAQAAHDRRVKLMERLDAQGTQDDEPAVVSTKDRVLDDPKHGFAGVGEFGAAVHAACDPSRGHAIDERLRMQAAATGNQQSVGSDGGYLVPPEFSNMIWDGMNQDPDNLLAMTDNYTVTGESLSFPANAETSRANGSRYGGVQGYWLSEAAQITSSKPTFRQVRIEPQELAVLVYATDKLLRNTTALDQYISRAATAEINFLVSDAIVNGTGAGQPKGILSSASRVTVAKETGQAASTIVADNLDKMWSRLHPKSRANAVWFINVDIEPQLQKLQQEIGTGGVPLYRPAGGLAGSPLATLKGRPVMPIEYCQTLGTEGDIILADMSAYCTGTRGGGVNSAMSIHLRFDYAETAFRFMFEADGQPWLASAITPKNGSNTLSPFVTLATRS